MHYPRFLPRRAARKRATTGFSSTHLSGSPTVPYRTSETHKPATKRAQRLAHQQASAAQSARPPQVAHGLARNQDRAHRAARANRACSQRADPLAERAGARVAAVTVSHSPVPSAHASSSRRLRLTFSRRPVSRMAMYSPWKSGWSSTMRSTFTTADRWMRTKRRGSRFSCIRVSVSRIT